MKASQIYIRKNVKLCNKFFCQFLQIQRFPRLPDLIPYSDRGMRMLTEAEGLKKEIGLREEKKKKMNEVVTSYEGSEGERGS